MNFLFLGKNRDKFTWVPVRKTLKYVWFFLLRFSRLTSRMRAINYCFYVHKNAPCFTSWLLLMINLRKALFFRLVVTNLKLQVLRFFIFWSWKKGEELEECSIISDFGVNEAFVLKIDQNICEHFCKLTLLMIFNNYVGEIILLNYMEIICFSRK